MPRKRKRTRRSRQEIQDLVAEFRASDLTQAQFARRTGLSQSVLGRWIRREEPAPGAFVRVDVKEGGSIDMPSAREIEIVGLAFEVCRGDVVKQKVIVEVEEISKTLFRKRPLNPPCRGA